MNTELVPNSSFMTGYDDIIGDIVGGDANQVGGGQSEVCLQVWDTAGQEVYRSLNRFYFRACSACIFVYDLTNEESFASLDSWVSEFVENCSAATPLEGVIRDEPF